MEIYPRRSGCRIACRLSSLCQSGHDTQRHLGGCALTVQDCLIHRKAQGFGKHLHDPGRQIDVVVFQKGIADRDKTSNFVSVQSDLVELKGQFIDRRTHLSPDSFRNSSGDGLTCLASDFADPHAVQQLAVSVHVFRDQIKEIHRDRQLSAADRSGLSLHGTQFLQECLDGFILQDDVSLLHRQRIKCALRHRQASDVDLLHNIHTSFFLLFRSLRLRDLPLFLRQLVFQVLDLLRETGLFLFVFCLFSLKGFHIRLDGVALFVGLDLSNRGLQLRLSGLDLRILRPERFQITLHFVDFMPQHNHFQCHIILLSVFS